MSNKIERKVKKKEWIFSIINSIDSTEVIDAIQFTDKNKDRCFNFVECRKAPDFWEGKPILVMETIYGKMTVELEDWIIKTKKGEFFSLKSDVFNALFEFVEGKPE